VIWALLATLLYLVATSQVCLLQNGETRFCTRTSFLSLALLAMALHTWVLYQTLFSTAGLNLGFFNAASLIAWVLVSLLLIAVSSKPIDSLAVVILPLAALSLLFAALFPSQRIISDTSLGVKAHIVTSLVGYSVLTMSAFQAVLLALQDYQLQHKHPGRIMRVLPPLQVMEELLLQMLSAGFVLLSIGLITGFVFLENLFAQHLAHKTALSLLAWVVFAGLLWGRWRYGWRGRVILRWTLAGFGLLMLAYFGSKFVLEQVLHRV